MGARTVTHLVELFRSSLANEVTVDNEPEIVLQALLGALEGSQIGSFVIQSV